MDRSAIDGCTTIARNIKLSGQPKLAKTFNLLNDQSMRGWSGYYYGLPLPASSLDKDNVDTNSEDGSFSRFGLTMDDIQNLTWTVKDNELVSGGGRSGGTGQQCVLQYSRPLSSGDKLEYEFFFVEGDYEVHPTLGCTAFMLRPDGLRQHWMTEPNSSWKTPADYEVEVRWPVCVAL